MLQTGTGSGACRAEKVQRESRERFLVWFVLIDQYQGLEQNRNKVTLHDKENIYLLHLCSFLFFFFFNKIYLQTVQKANYSEVLFLLTILNQDQGSLSAPSMDCLCKSGATAVSVLQFRSVKSSHLALFN